MKKFLLIILMIFLTGCVNNEENIKNEYIAMKNNLLSANVVNKDNENLPLDIIVNLDRSSEDIIKYDVILKNPKENMRNIKAMVVHNYHSEEIFPSIGVFDMRKNLLMNDETEQEVKLVGTIETTKNISNLNLEIKIWLQYTNDSEEIKEIYYKAT